MYKDTESVYDDIEKPVDNEEQTDHHTSYKIPTVSTDEDKHHLSSMYQSWFLDYASYVNLERAIPHMNDGLKPVQRRVLHAMKRKDDGRFNKVANLVGETMQFHPHGDASIYEALVNLGQKNLLIDCQGNWGNILTGDSAAAPRYIEARLSKFAIEAVFNPKTTNWKLSYDGRNKEPIFLPVKFPLLLAQGSEGIGLGLNSKILPHNFNELIEASIAYLQNKSFQLYPDFPTGGYIDISKYNDGERGGRIRIRAKIEKSDNKTLIIKEIPFGTNTSKLIETILKANEKGKINIKKIDDNTAGQVEIQIHLDAKTSSDKTIDALYAFTQCEINYSPNCCVVENNKPLFTSVSNILKSNTDQTVSLLKTELEIQRNELKEQLHFCSLEKIFIEERIYKDKEFETANSTENALKHIGKRLEPFKESLIREITNDDLQRLLEVKMARILKFNADQSDKNIAVLKQQIAQIEHNIKHIIDYTIDWFISLKNKYGKHYPRLTEIRNFETIEASKVAEANEKLYLNIEEGFIGTSLKKDQFVCNCSDLDDIILFYKNGKYKIVKVAEKLFVGKNILHVNLFKKNDKRTIYNTIYRDGKSGVFYIKRFSVSSVTRDKEYDLTQGNPNSKIYYFSANPNGEAETVKVVLKPTSRRIRNLVFEKDFSELAIKGRQAIGNILTKFEVQKITLKQKGGSTLGGTPIWFDSDINRLNIDQRGIFLGEFFPNDNILVLCKNGDYYTTDFDLNNHYDENLLRIEKFNPNKIWSVVLLDADQQNFPYLKRFQVEVSPKKRSVLGDNIKSKLLIISDTQYPRFEVKFGGNSQFRDNLIIDAEDFIGVKSMKAKGKRITIWEIADISEIEPASRHEPEKTDSEFTQEEPSNDEYNALEKIKNQTHISPKIRIERKEETDDDTNAEDESGQMSLF